MQSRNGCAEMRLARIPELGHQRMLLERVLDDAALDALAAAVNQPDLAQAGGIRGPDVLVDHRSDVARMERMEVESVFDRNRVRHEPEYVAVTTVFMPPRTEKSPVTVMRRGWQAPTKSSRIWLVTAS